VQPFIGDIELTLHRGNDIAVPAKSLGAGALVTERAGFGPVRQLGVEFVVVECRRILGDVAGSPVTELLELEAELLEAAETHLGMADFVPDVPGGIVIKLEGKIVAGIENVGNEL